MSDASAAVDATRSGPFCRDCGLATFRDTMGWCLTVGWLSPLSLLFVPQAVVANLGARRQVLALGAPGSPAPGRSPRPVGRTLWLRWQILGALVPIALIAAALGIGSALNARRAATNQRVGMCVDVAQDPATLASRVWTVPCGEPHNGVVTKIVQAVDDCPPGTLAATANGTIFCVTTH